MNHKTVTLTDGSQVRVYPPPTIQIEAILAKKHPMPEVPTITETTASGKVMTMSIDDDPEYLRQVKVVEEKQQKEREELHYLFALRDAIPPEGWDVDTVMGDEIRYMNPDWKPREGKVGCKLDWIEWGILGDMVNATLIGQALNELIAVNTEVIAQVEESF